MSSQLKLKLNQLLDEFFVCEDHLNKTLKITLPGGIIAKNKNGYHNLAKLSSKAYTDGFYMFQELIKN